MLLFIAFFLLTVPINYLHEWKPLVKLPSCSQLPLYAQRRIIPLSTSPSTAVVLKQRQRHSGMILFVIV